MVFQDPMTSLNPVLTVGDQIAEAIQLHNTDLSKEEVDNKVKETLKMVGILSVFWRHEAACRYCNGVVLRT